MREVPWRKTQYTGGDNPEYAQTCGQPHAGETQEPAKGTSREVRGQEVGDQRLGLRTVELRTRDGIVGLRNK